MTLTARIADITTILIKEVNDVYVHAGTSGARRSAIVDALCAVMQWTMT